jgi:hypothetical protein
MRFHSLFLALVASFLVAQFAAAGTVSLAPSKDNTLIQQTTPTAQLSNGLGDVFVGRTNQDGQGPATISIRRGLENFNVAGSVPAGATITGVSLTLRDKAATSGNSTIELHRALQDWGEGSSFQDGGTGVTATNGDASWLYTFYNAASPGLSPTWTTPGGSFDPTVSGSVVDSLSAPGLLTWSSATNPQMLADVQSWLDNPLQNFGWIILGNESAGKTATRFNSRESTTSPNVAPVLTIDYVLAPEPTSLALGIAAALCGTIIEIARRRRS